MNEGLFVPISELKEIAEKIVNQVTSEDYWNGETVRAAILLESEKINTLQTTINTWKTIGCTANTSIPNSKKILASLKDLGPYIIFYMFSYDLFVILNDMITQMNANINNSSRTEIETNITTLIGEGFEIYKTYSDATNKYNNTSTTATEKNIAKNKMNTSLSQLNLKLEAIKTALKAFESSNKGEYDTYWRTITPDGTLVIDGTQISVDESRKKFVEKIISTLTPITPTNTDNATQEFLTAILNSVIKESNAKAVAAKKLEVRRFNYNNIKEFTNALLQKYKTSDPEKLDKLINNFSSEEIIRNLMKDIHITNPGIMFMSTFPFTNKEVSKYLDTDLQLDDLEIVIHYANEFPTDTTNVNNTMIVIWCKCFIIKLAQLDNSKELLAYFDTPKKMGGGTKRKKSKGKNPNYTRKNLSN